MEKTSIERLKRKYRATKTDQQKYQKKDAESEDNSKSRSLLEFVHHDLDSQNNLDQAIFFWTCTSMILPSFQCVFRALNTGTYKKDSYLSIYLSIYLTNYISIFLSQQVQSSFFLSLLVCSVFSFFFVPFFVVGDISKQILQQFQRYFTINSNGKNKQTNKLTNKKKQGN